MGLVARDREPRRDRARAFAVWLALLGVGGLVMLGAFGLTGALTGSGPLSAGMGLVTGLGVVTLAARRRWL